MCLVVIFPVSTRSQRCRYVLITIPRRPITRYIKPTRSIRNAPNLWDVGSISWGFWYRLVLPRSGTKLHDGIMRRGAMSIKCLVTIVHAFPRSLTLVYSVHGLNTGSRSMPYSGFPIIRLWPMPPRNEILSRLRRPRPFPTELLFAVHVIGSVVPLQQPSLDSPDAIGRRERRNVRECIQGASRRRCTCDVNCRRDH
jgi:hypothetical protein